MTQRAEAQKGLRRLLGSLTIALLATCAIAAPAGANPGLPAYDAVGPAGASIEVDVSTGAPQRSEIVLSNTGAEPVELHLAPVDATTTEDGSLAYGDSGQPPTGPGRWITVAADHVTIEPGSVQRVPVTVEAPPGRSGLRYAGVAVWVPAPAPAPGAPGTAQMTVLVRRVVPIHLNFGGSPSTRVMPEGLEAVATPQGEALALTLTNTGDLLSSAEGEILIGGATIPFALAKVVPETTAQPQFLLAAPLPNGSHRAEVRLRHDAGEESWSGNLTVGDDLAEQVNDKAGHTLPGFSPAAQGTANALQAGGAATLIAGTLLSLAWWLRRNRLVHR